MPPAMMDRIDCWTLTLWRRLHVVRSARALASGLRELAVAAIHERRLVRGVTAAAAVGHDDARWLGRIGGRPVEVIPNGVALAAAATAVDEAPRPTVAFTGVLNYGPNVEAAVFLARQIWPRVRALMPDAQLVIAGQSPAPEVAALACGDAIEILADVTDMQALLRRAWLAAAPMQSGAGIKNKVLEAWAVGRPVVLSRMATNGLDLDAEGSTWVADGAQQIADKILRLLSSAEDRMRAGAHARAFVTAHHSWGGAARRLSGLLNTISAAPRS